MFENSKCQNVFSESEMHNFGGQKEGFFLSSLEVAVTMNQWKIPYFCP